LDYSKNIDPMKTLFVLKIILILILGPAIYAFNIYKRESGKVIDKIHVPCYTREIDSYSYILDAPMKEYRVVPDKYKLIVNFSGRGKSLCVSEETYIKFQQGDLFTTY